MIIYNHYLLCSNDPRHNVIVTRNAQQDGWITWCAECPQAREMNPLIDLADLLPVPYTPVVTTQANNDT